MATLLLVVIYSAYIALGVPDSLLGSAWPAIYPEFNIPVSMANAVSTLTSIGTVISSLLSAKLINKLGTARLTAVSTSLTAIALLGYSVSGNILFMCLCALPLGLGAGAVDAAQNNYVALHYNANHMNFLHCFYGVGVAISPYLMSLGLSGGSWRKGYLYAVILQSVIALITIAAIPLWAKAHPQTKIEEGEKVKSVSIFKLFKMKGVKPTWGMFIFSCGIESICTVWGSTFLVQAKDILPETAAKIIVLYFLGLTCARFFSGLAAKKLTPMNLMHIGCTILALSVIILMLPTGNLFLCASGLFLMGFGVGPIYPNMTYLAPINFGKNLSAAIIGSQMAVSYIGIMFLPIIFGCLAQFLSAAILPYFQLCVFALLILSLFALMRYIGGNKNVQ